MATLLIQHQVKDYAAWKKVFDSVQELRTASGEIGNQIYRDAANPNKLTVVNTWDSMENAQKFAQSPELRAAMKDAGVEGKPNMSFLNKA
jgi:quinol monooxygenase YgiN